MPPIKIHFISVIIFLVLMFFEKFCPCLFAATGEMEQLQQLQSPVELAQPPEPFLRPHVEYDAQNLRDPFTNLVTSIEKTPGSEEARGEEESKEFNLPALAVRGIIWGGKFPQAIINDKVVKVGDTIEGARVIDITKEGITCLFQGRQFGVSSPALNLSPPKNLKER